MNGILKTLCLSIMICFFIFHGFNHNLSAQSEPSKKPSIVEAWEALDNRDFKKAIEIAEKRIDDLEQEEVTQKDLKKSNTPLPPVGQVNQAQREIIFSRGGLNELGTFWFIKARALEKKGDRNEAIKAYQKASEFTYSRVWDPKGEFFWDPSDAAKKRLRFLTETKSLLPNMLSQ